MPEGLKGTEKGQRSWHCLSKARDTEPKPGQWCLWALVPPRSDSASKNTKAGEGALETTAGNKQTWLSLQLNWDSSGVLAANPKGKRNKAT